MSLVDDIFYDLGPVVTEILADTDTTFRITRRSNRMFEHPSQVTEYRDEEIVELRCTKPYKNKNKEDVGGVSRDDLTNRRLDTLFISIPEKNINDKGVSFPESIDENAFIEVLYKGRWIRAKNIQPIGSDIVTSRIIEFAS